MLSSLHALGSRWVRDSVSTGSSVRRRALLGLGAALLIVLLAMQPLAWIPFALVILVLAWVAWPGVILGVSFTGFFLYLGVMRVAGVEPRTATTFSYYLVVAGMLCLTAWDRRAVIVARLRNRSRIVMVWIAAAGFLAAWFSLNVLLLSEGALSRRLLGVFVLATIPSMIVALSADERIVRQLQRALIVLALLVAGADLYALLLPETSDTVRFSPLAGLDPINAALVPVYGALAAVTLAPRTARGRIAVLGLVAVLCAAALLPGTRGPFLALVVAIGIVTICALFRASAIRRRFQIAAMFAAVVGLMVGAALSQTFLDAKTNTVLDAFGVVNDSGTGTGTDTGEPISSLSIRRQWLEEAIRAVPDKPILGHGVASLVDDTPEAQRMGIAGQKVYPHSDVVEAAYSLGLVGLIPFLALVLIPIVMLIGLVKRLHAPHSLFVIGLFTAAFVVSNTSGEIGADVILWSGAALAVVAGDQRTRVGLEPPEEQSAETGTATEARR